MSTPKVLVVGAIQGHLEKAFQKISKLQIKQNFSFAIVVGDLFASDNSEQFDLQLTLLLNGSIKVSLPTYFTTGDSPLPLSVQEKLESNDGSEICTNLFFLGRKGTLKTTEGIRIVNLGGRLVQNEASVTKSIGKYDSLYLESEAKSLQGAHSAHILITNQWPSNVTSNSQVPIPESVDPSAGVQPISDLCLALRPRYHFSSTPSAIWSREPFMSPPSVEGRKLKSYEELDGPVVTRFSSLASVENSNKEWLSAFTLDPTKPPSTDGAQQSCPLISSTPKRKRAAEDDEANTNGYSRYNRENNRSNNSRHNKKFKSDPSSCFMCMSNPTFNTTMVVSIAEESILTVLKGPLSLRGKTFPTLTSSGHIMIIPMYHAADEAAHGKRTTTDLETEFAEMTKYRHALYKMMASKGLGAVCWEVNRTGIRHMHWQLIACPTTDKITPDLIEAAYKLSASKNKYPTFQPCDANTLLPSQPSDFFRLWIYSPSPSADPASNPKPTLDPPANPQPQPLTPTQKADILSSGSDLPAPPPQGHEKSLYFPIPTSERFNISFGREVMAGLLQLEDRVRWQDVESGGDIEEKDAEAWKEDFRNWDWAME